MSMPTSHPSDADFEAIREIRKKYVPQFLELARTINEAAKKITDIDEQMCEEGYDGSYEKRHVTFDSVNNAHFNTFGEVMCMTDSFVDHITMATTDDPTEETAEVDEKTS